MCLVCLGWRNLILVTRSVFVIFRVLFYFVLVCFLHCLSHLLPGGYDNVATTAVDKVRITRLTKAGKRRQTGQGNRPTSK